MENRWKKSSSAVICVRYLIMRATECLRSVRGDNDDVIGNTVKKDEGVYIMLSASTVFALHCIARFFKRVRGGMTGMKYTSPLAKLPPGGNAYCLFWRPAL